MPEISTHPTTQALALFGHGKLSEAQAATVAAHLETCADCRKAVAGLPPDSFMGKVRAAKPGGTVLPPGPAPARPAASLSLAGRPPASSAPLANVPPELANHPKFRIVRELGRGGMGVIYLAEHRVMEKQVALKVINPAVLENPEALARFHVEVRAAAKLDHQNIARAYDADQAGDLHFLVMEFVEGMSLAQLLEQKGPLPVASACHFVRQAALGLHHAFEHGMVHRDVKPQNLMVTPKGLVKVLDFGLARVRGGRKAAPRLTQLESFMGTPEYVAPEQATDARSADTRADVYSLGCTLYALLTGRPPFVEDTVANLVLAHIEKEPLPLHEVRPDVPPELSAVVAKMLAKDPAQRYQRPIEVAQALVPFVKPGGKPGAAGRVSVPPMASAGTGTRIGGDTSRVKGLDQGEEKRPAKAPAAEEEKGSPFGDLADAPAAAPKEAKATPAASWKRRPVLAGVAVAVFALAVGAWLLAGVVFKAKVKTPDGEAIIVVEVDRPGAEVLVDGDKMTVTWGDGGKKAEIRVKPGTHKVEVKKDGLTLRGEEVEIEDGGRKIVTARLDKTPPTAPVRPAGPADPEAKEAAADQSRRLWVQAHGYFIRGLDKDWFEKWDDGRKAANMFSEVQRTEEFVELRHYHVPVAFRLYKDKALIKDERNSAEFVQLYEGEWQKEPASADQSRRLWVEDHGYLIEGLGNDWFQKWDDGRKEANIFSEVQRTKEFVEVRHYHIPVTFRLYKDKALMKDEGNSAEFVQSGEGKWQETPK